MVRRLHQSLVIGDSVEIVILEIRDEQVRIGIKYPKGVSIHRKEIYDQIAQEPRESGDSLA